MKASETNSLKFLQGTKQFVTPIYQRRYTWTKKACQQLLEDIERASSPKIAGHFIGAIVYIENSLYHVSSVTQLSVIDGQQRIATFNANFVSYRETTRQDGTGNRYVST